MKLFWKPDEASYHWIDEAKLKGTPPEDDGIEEVLVGPAATADDGFIEQVVVDTDTSGGGGTGVRQKAIKEKTCVSF
jgi:hypothetical protein